MTNGITDARMHAWTTQKQYGPPTSSKLGSLLRSSGHFFEVRGIMKQNIKKATTMLVTTVASVSEQALFKGIPALLIRISSRDSLSKTCFANSLTESKSARSRR